MNVEAMIDLGFLVEVAGIGRHHITAKGPRWRVGGDENTVVDLPGYVAAGEPLSAESGRWRTHHDDQLLYGSSTTCG